MKSLLPCSRILTRDSRGPGGVEVGRSERRLEEDQRSYRCHQDSEGPRPEGGGRYWGISRKEGGTADDACAPTVSDGPRCVTGRDDACGGGALRC